MTGDEHVYGRINMFFPHLFRQKGKLAFCSYFWRIIFVLEHSVCVSGHNWTRWIHGYLWVMLSPISITYSPHENLSHRVPTMWKWLWGDEGTSHTLSQRKRTFLPLFTALVSYGITRPPVKVISLLCSVAKHPHTSAISAPPLTQEVEG